MDLILRSTFYLLPGDLVLTGRCHIGHFDLRLGQITSTGHFVALFGLHAVGIYGHNIVVILGTDLCAGIGKRGTGNGSQTLIDAVLTGGTVDLVLGCTVHCVPAQLDLTSGRYIGNLYFGCF